eukprot:m.10914 g.10914  ORF g.10914 m.10914 type:complete len:321 (-) comp2574_c0_seq2:672-1634(-)
MAAAAGGSSASSPSRDDVQFVTLSAYLSEIQEIFELIAVVRTDTEALGVQADGTMRRLADEVASEVGQRLERVHREVAQAIADVRASSESVMRQTKYEIEKHRRENRAQVDGLKQDLRAQREEFQRDLMSVLAGAPVPMQRSDSFSRRTGKSAERAKEKEEARLREDIEMAQRREAGDLLLERKLEAATQSMRDEINRAVTQSAAFLENRMAAEMAAVMQRVGAMVQESERRVERSNQDARKALREEFTARIDQIAGTLKAQVRCEGWHDEPRGGGLGSGVAAWANQFLPDLFDVPLLMYHALLRRTHGRLCQSFNMDLL